MGQYGDLRIEPEHPKITVLPKKAIAYSFLRPPASISTALESVEIGEDLPGGVDKIHRVGV
jgi:hypothetical protein